MDYVCGATRCGWHGWAGGAGMGGGIGGLGCYKLVWSGLGTDGLGSAGIRDELGGARRGSAGIGGDRRDGLLCPLSMCWMILSPINYI